MIWDVDQNRALKFQHYESCTSLSWFPGSCTTVVSGSAMGWVKVFDTRSNSQSPVIQWLAHPANRPRKIKGLRPDCFHDSNILATFSDAYGDFVKVWDLRQIPTRNSTKKTGILQAFGINPYFAGHDISNVSGVINDCAWSTIRSGVIAVATSSQRCVSFFRYKEDQPQDNSVNTVSSMPLYTISTPDQVKSLSWQSVDSSKVWASTSSATDNNVLLLNDASTTELSSEQANKYEFMEFSDKRKNDILKFEHKLSKQPNRTGTSKRLLGALQTGVYDMDVRDDIPFSFGNNILAVVHSSGRLGISATSIDQLNVPQCKVLSSLTLSEKLLYCFKDQNQLMKDRASSGYSLDASTNIDILTEELNCLHKSMISNTDTSLNMANMALSNAVYEVYRVWDWLDRFEASNDSKESIQKSGILHVLNIQDVGRVSEIKAKIDESFVTFHPESGAPTYHSKNRAIIRKLCGWVNTQLLDGSNNNSTSSLPSSAANHGKFKSFSWGDLPVQSESSIAGGENDLLVHIVENCMQYSFERAAIVALWHGDLSYAVRILHDAVDSHNKSKLPLFTSSHNYSDQGRNLAGSKVLYEENADNENDIDEISSGTKDSSVEWDYPVTDNYMQVVALVGMCIAGYYPNHSEPKSIQVSRDRQSWKTMCEHVLYQLRAFERTAASYLSAGCLFLLANCSETKMNQNSVQRYMNILDDPNLVLEDRISFASNYLDDEDLVSWLIQLKLTCMKKGSLEGLLLTGLSHQGCDILQGFIDRTHDIQTAALISSRVMHLQESNSNKEDEQAHSRIVIWLHSYRTLLTKWQMNIERAHLDIEIGQLVQKNKQSKASKSASSKGDIVHAGRGRGGVGPQQQRIPIYEGALTKTSKLMQFSFVKLKCNFCNAFLPMDDLPSTRTEGLRSSKSILNCCASCGKQLPRCYVCQLHMVSFFVHMITLIS